MIVSTPLLALISNSISPDIVASPFPDAVNLPVPFRSAEPGLCCLSSAKISRNTAVTSLSCCCVSFIRLLASSRNSLASSASSKTPSSSNPLCIPKSSFTSPWVSFASSSASLYSSRSCSGFSVSTPSSANLSISALIRSEMDSPRTRNESTLLFAVPRIKYLDSRLACCHISLISLITAWNSSLVSAASTSSFRSSSWYM